MKSTWQVYGRKSADLLEHLCAIRNLDPKTLKPDFLTGLHDPYLLPNMQKAVELISYARENNELVVIFGDYDADGTPAAALLSIVFHRLNIRHQVLLPSRQDGYGLSNNIIEKLPKDTELLVTVDNGVTAEDPINLAHTKGIKVVVIDHHLPKSELPKAEAIIDPFISGNKYPFTDLCGCALAWKVAVALSKKYPKELTEGFVKWLLDLVAISTVADMMPLVGENRTLVHYGLEVLRLNRRTGLRAMIEKASLDTKTLTAGTLGYSIGPRLNASGRLGDNTPSLELLLTVDDTTAAQLASKIEQANRQRQELVERILVEAENELFKQNQESDFCYLLLGSSWHSGVVGLVAGRISSKYNRPVVVGSLSGDGLVTASARSTDRYSMIDGLTAQSQYLDRFGGHVQAAGLSLKEKNWSKFVDVLKAHAASKLTEDDITPRYLADAILLPAEISAKTIQTASSLQPFGLQNREPLFVLENIKLGNMRTMGSRGAHVKWPAQKERASFDVIGFGFAEKLKKAGQNFNEANLLGYLESNTWQGNTKLQLRLLDIAPTAQPFEII